MHVAALDFQLTLWRVRNVVFFLAIIAMNYTLSRPSPVDFLFVLAGLLSLFLNQRFRITFILFIILVGTWAVSFYVASIPFLDEQVVRDEIFKKTFVVGIGLIAAYVSMSWGPQQYHRFLFVYIFSCVIAATLGVFGFIANIEELLWDGRSRAFIDDPNMYGSFLIPAVIGCVYLLNQGIGRKIVLVPAITILALGVLFSFSRAATVGMSACLLVYITFLNRANIMRLVGYVAALVVVGAMLFGTALVVAPNFSEKFLERATVAKSYDLGREGRYARYARSLPMILDNPVGIGIVQQEKIFTEPIHNMFLSSFLNYGWAGGSAWLVLFFASVVLSIWNYKTTRSPIAVLLLFCWLGPVLGTLLHEGEHWRHLWLWLGLLWGFNVQNFPRKNGTAIPVPREWVVSGIPRARAPAMARASLQR